MGNCKDCRWWRKKTDDEWGYCLLTETSDGEPLLRRDAPVTRNKARAMGQIRYPEGVLEAWLETLPDFGCVQFEAKQP